MYDWNDLKHLLALAEHGSLNAAARSLQVDPSTVQRRLAELEGRLGQPLVERLPAGYRLTNLGQQVLGHARRMQEAAQALQQSVDDARRELRGTVRVTCPEPIMYRLARSDLLEHFRARHPGLVIEFVMSDRYLDLRKGEADIALRSGDPEDGALVGRAIADSLWGVYGSARYLERHGRPASVQELARHALVGLDEGMAQHRAAQWLRSAVPGARIVARNDSVLGLLYSAKASVGLAPLPTALGDAEAELVRVLGPIPELTRRWRVLTTRELRQAPRVAALFDFMVAQSEALRPILTG